MNRKIPCPQGACIAVERLVINVFAQDNFRI
jgi:hypothetical protein